MQFFFSDDGSTAVEISLKIAYQYFKNIGDKGRSIFLHLEGGYHGDTMGAMSVSGKNSKYHYTFSELFFDTISIEVPEYYEGVDGIEEKEDRIIDGLEKKLSKTGGSICAFIVEPLIQGASGMKLHRPEFLQKLVTTIRKYEILIIFDEVMTGFYRTGKFFAMDHLNVTPDLICLSKGLTGGFLPLGLTVATEKIYNAFLSDDTVKTFVHGHSYTANPITCAAANKSMEILLRPETTKRISEISKFHQKSFIKNIHKRRTLGTISAFDVDSANIAQSVVDIALENGIFLRPLDNTIYFLPPYCITDEELMRVYEFLGRYL